MTDPTEAALLARAAELAERIASCHEVVDCPKCKAPPGRRCVFRPASATPGVFRPDRELRHPHRERWTRLVPER